MFVISISPLSGYRQTTVFTVMIDPSAVSNVINWGDATFSSESTASHIFEFADEYTVFAGNCESTSAFNVSVYNSPFLEKTVAIDYDSLTTTAGCANIFTINLSSDVPQETIFLYSSGSNSYPFSDNTFWSHLNPSWQFKYNDIPISELTMDLSPVLSGDMILGYTGSSAVSYTDDMPGSPVLFFTVQLPEGINSRVYSALQQNITNDIPYELAITSDGINNISPTQFADIEIPYIISVKGLSACGNIMHYASGSIVEYRMVQGCNGISPTAYSFPLSSILLTDDDCFSTGGYIKTSLVIPVSAIPPNTTSLSYFTDSCGNDTPEIQEYSSAQNNPFSISISANAEIWVDGTMYSISGESSPFDVYRLDEFYEFYRKGEDKTVYDLIQRYNHFDLHDTPLFNSYLSAVMGTGDSLGKVYDKIVNFAQDNNDPDLCTIDALVNMGELLDNPVDKFGLEFPEELRRLMNMFSIPTNKLIGTRCVCNTNFTECQSCKGVNICGLCGFDKKSNVGKLLTSNDQLDENTTVLIRKNGSSVYDLYLVPESTTVSNITAFDISDYCVFEWNSTPQNNPVESVIDYKNPQTTINRSLSTANDWILSDGLMDQIIEKVLVDNLLNN